MLVKHQQQHNTNITFSAPSSSVTQPGAVQPSLHQRTDPKPSYSFGDQIGDDGAMALSSALRREGKRLASLTAASSCSLKSLTASSPFALSKAEEVHAFGTRSISTQIVRNRIKSVTSIQKITKAMKMVASSKLRAIQTKTENSRGLWKPFTALVGDVPDLDAKKYVVITVTSDKGLCGGINSTCAKISKALAKIESGPEKEVKHIILGEKGRALFVRDSKKDMSLSITEMQKNPLNFTQVSVVVDDILKNLEFDAIKIVFNKFQSIVKFEPTIATVLSPEALEKESDTGGVLGRLEEYELEGAETKAEIYQNLSEFHLACSLFNACLENACSEQGARMSAMDSSSRNAGEMLDKLTLFYNRTRQASITTELTEIISGASALEQKE